MAGILALYLPYPVFLKSDNLAFVLIANSILAGAHDYKLDTRYLQLDTNGDLWNFFHYTLS